MTGLAKAGAFLPVSPNHPIYPNTRLLSAGGPFHRRKLKAMKLLTELDDCTGKTIQTMEFDQVKLTELLVIVFTDNTFVVFRTYRSSYDSSGFDMEDTFDPLTWPLPKLITTFGEENATQMHQAAAVKTEIAKLKARLLELERGQ